MSKCRVLCGRHDCKRLGCAEHRNGMGKKIKRRETIVSWIFGTLALLILFLGFFAGWEQAKGNEVADVYRTEVPGVLGKGTDLRVIAFLGCTDPLYYVISTRGLMDYFSFAEMQSDPKISYVVGMAIAKLEIAGGQPAIIYLDRAMGIKCASL